MTDLLSQFARWAWETLLGIGTVIVVLLAIMVLALPGALGILFLDLDEELAAVFNLLVLGALAGIWVVGAAVVDGVAALVERRRRQVRSGRESAQMRPRRR